MEKFTVPLDKPLPFFKINTTPTLLIALHFKKVSEQKSSSTKFYQSNYETYFFMNDIYFLTTRLHTFPS